MTSPFTVSHFIQLNHILQVAAQTLSLEFTSECERMLFSIGSSYINNNNNRIKQN
jgi:hypothetical protein